MTRDHESGNRVEPTGPRVLRIDAIHRAVHAWNGVMTLLLLASGAAIAVAEPGAARAAITALHLRIGHWLVLGVAARIVWLVAGPAPARLGGLWRAARRLGRARHDEPDAVGTHPEAALAYLAFFGVLGAAIATGLALQATDRGTGPLAGWFFEDLALEAGARWIHQGAAWAAVAFVVVHMAGLVRAERRDGVPYAQAMVSGFKYAAPDRRANDRREAS